MSSKFVQAKNRKGEFLDIKKYPRNEVLLNIYDLGESKAMAKINIASNAIGGGVYHGGVEVFGVEWSYGCTDDDISGVGTCQPRAHPCHSYRCTVPMGQTKLGEIKVAKVLRKLEEEWRGTDYHFIKHNCLDFCSALCQELGCDKIPSWVDRYGRTAEKIGNVVSSPISGIKRASNFFGTKKEKGPDSPRNTANSPFGLGLGLDKNILAEYRDDSDSDEDWYNSRARGCDQWDGLGLRKKSGFNASNDGAFGRSPSLDLGFAGGGGFVNERSKDPFGPAFGFSSGLTSAGTLSTASTATPSSASSPKAKPRAVPGKAPPAAKAKGAPRKTPGASPAPNDPSKSPAPRATPAGKAPSPPGAKKPGPRPSTPDGRPPPEPKAANAGGTAVPAAAAPAPAGPPPKAKAKSAGSTPKPSPPKAAAVPVVPKANSDEPLMLPVKAVPGRPRGSKEKPPAKAGVRSPSVAPPPMKHPPEGAEPQKVPKAKTRSPSVAPPKTAPEGQRQPQVPKGRSPSVPPQPRNSSAEPAGSQAAQQQPSAPKAKAPAKKAADPAAVAAKPKGQASPPSAASQQADTGSGEGKPVRRRSQPSSASGGKDARSLPQARTESPGAPKVPQQQQRGDAQASSSAESGGGASSSAAPAAEAAPAPAEEKAEEEEERERARPTPTTEPASLELVDGFSEVATGPSMQEGQQPEGEEGTEARFGSAEKQVTGSTVASETSSAPPEEGANSAFPQGVRRDEATAEEQQALLADSPGAGDQKGLVDPNPVWVEATESFRRKNRTESL